VRVPKLEYCQYILVICVTWLIGYPNVKPAAAAASCRSPDEVDIKTRKDRDFQRKRRISETRYRTKEHGQYGSKVEID
jgi:hypothetical protein